MVIGNPIVLGGGGSISPSDEGKVVINGALVAQTSVTKTANGTYDTTTNNEVVVNVSAGGELGYKYLFDSSMAEVGGVNANTAGISYSQAKVTSSNRVRSAIILPVEVGKQYKATAQFSLGEICLYAFDSSQNLVSSPTGFGAWQSQDFSFTAQYPYIAMMIKNSSNTDISASFADSLQMKLIQNIPSATGVSF